jgi:DnaA family protein
MNTLAPTQLLLGLQPPQEPGFDNFVVGDNREAVGQVRALTTNRAATSLFLWGPTGCGKSHLLGAAMRATASRRSCMCIDDALDTTDFKLPPGSLVIADDVEQLSQDHQTLLFRIFNSARIAGLDILLSGSSPPLLLPLREDLRTRIGQCLVLQLNPLTEAERCAALQRHAQARGMQLDASLVQYLMRHGRRDLPSLMAVLDHLDRLSLEQKKHPSLPMLRELLQSNFDFSAP